MRYLLLMGTMRRAGRSSAIIALLPFASASAVPWDAALRFVPPRAHTVIAVDLAALRASGALAPGRWEDVVARLVMVPVDRRDILREASWVVWFPSAEGGDCTIAAFPEGAHAGTGRNLGDGVLAFGQAADIAAIHRRRAPKRLRALIAALPKDAPIVIASSRPELLASRMPRGTLRIAIVLSQSLDLTGEMTGTATLSDVRAGLDAILEPLRIGGCPGTALAQGATLRIDPRGVLFTVAIPMNRLVSPEEPASPTSQMVTARGGHAAAALPDGTVIVAGGYDGHEGLWTIERIEPWSGASEMVPQLLSERRVASAYALLPPARLFIWYGMPATGADPLSPSVEIVDVEAGTVSAAPDPPTPGRIGATATVLDDGTILLVGGAERSRFLGDAYLLDPGAGTYRRLDAGLALPRSDHAAVKLRDGRVLIAGGAIATDALTESLEVFDPVRETFDTLPETLPSARTGLAATALHDGSVIVAGGFDAEDRLRNILRFSSSPGCPIEAGRMQEPRYYFCAVTLADGRVMFVGGGLRGEAMRMSFEIWDPDLGGGR